MKVLLADDDRALVHMLGAVFRKRRWTVVQAFDAMQAVMYTKHRPQPNAIVLDLGMPGGTGFGVMETLARSARTSAIPIVVLTGEPSEEIEEKALDLGAAAFFRKPIEPDALVDEVERFTGAPPG